MSVYAREKAPFEAEFPLLPENLIEDKFISTGTLKYIDQHDPEPTSRVVCSPKNNHDYITGTISSLSRVKCAALYRLHSFLKVS